MGDKHVPVRSLRTITPAPAGDRLQRFEAWPDDIRVRAYELGASIAARSAPRTEFLLAQELGEGVAVPADSTIRLWASQEAWAARADADLARSHGRTLRELQAGFLGAIVLAQSVLIDSMCGRLDAAPYGGSGRIKSAEIVLRLAERADLRLLGDGTPAFDLEEDTSHLSIREQSARMRQIIIGEKKGRQ